MTRYEARFAVGDTAATSSFTVADGLGSLVGALLVPDEDEGYADAIERFTQRTGRPLLVRRHDYGNTIPESLEDSDTAHDLGAVRKSVLTFSPEKGCQPADLGEFLQSCRQSGVIADIALWPEMHRFMDPVKYNVLCELYVPVIREHGYRHLFAVTNYGAVMKDVMARYWPGDKMVDTIGVAFYPSGMSLTAAARFADEHGKPFGIADLGVEHHHLRHRLGDSLSFLAYTEVFFAERIRDGRPCGDIIWVDGHRDGDFRFTLVPEFVEVYRNMCDTLVT